MSSATKREIYFFFPNLYAVYFVLFLFLFYCIRRTFSTILNKIGKSTSSFWILAWKYLVSCHLLAVLFFSDIICQKLRSIALYLNLLFWIDIGFFSNALPVSMNIIMIIFPLVSWCDGLNWLIFKELACVK